jgi:site-specific DNA recombinase
MRLADQIDQDTFGAKATELRDRLASIKLQLESVDRTTEELAELALKVFDPKNETGPQTLTEKWLTADYAKKIAESSKSSVCGFNLRGRLDGATLCPTMRKPFDVLAEGLLISSSRGDRI